jgi:hypothetical protein
MSPPPKRVHAVAYSGAELTGLRKKIATLATSLDGAGRDLDAAIGATFAACGNDDYGAAYRGSQQPTLEAAAGLLRLLSAELEARAGDLTIAMSNYEAADTLPLRPEAES